MELVNHSRNEALRQILQNELVRRCKKNAKYSLRSFARALTVDASLLSKMLKKQRPISDGVRKKILDRLEVSPEKFPQFYDEKPSIKEVDNFQLIVADQFHIISNWYYYALLELIGFEPSNQNSANLAQRLGISVNEVNVATERLERLKFIAKEESGAWVKCVEDFTTIGNDFTTSGLRHMQRQVLEKAIEALEEVPFSDRDQSTLTIATSKSLIPEVKERIKKLRREINQLTKDTADYEDVYNLVIAFYPVTKSTRREKHV